MHRLVLERGEDGLGTAHRAMFAAVQIEFRVAERLDDGVVCAPAKRQHLIAGRPGGLRSRTRHRQLDAVGVDATLEQALHPGVDAWQTEPALQQGNYAEGREVALIEDDGIAQRDRPREVGRRIDEIEEAARAFPIALIPVDEQLAIDSGWVLDGRGNGGHCFPFHALVLPELRRPDGRRGFKGSSGRKTPTAVIYQQTIATLAQKASPTRCRAGRDATKCDRSAYLQVAAIILMLLTFSEGAAAEAGRAAGSAAGAGLAAIVPVTSTSWPT